MANWISSKLKAAETILQQAFLSPNPSSSYSFLIYIDLSFNAFNSCKIFINLVVIFVYWTVVQIDQQAADSLRKNERPLVDELNINTQTKPGGIVPLKDQLKKKPQESNDYNGKLRSDPNFTTINNSRDKEISIAAKPSPKPKSTLTDSDWTELLGTPNQSPNSGANRSNGGTAIRGLRKDGKRRGSLGSGRSNVLVSEVNRNQKSSNSNSVLRSKAESKLNGRAGDGEESSSSDSLGRSSSVDLQSDGSKYLEGREIGRNGMGVKLVGKPKNEGNEENGGHFDSKGVSSEDSSPSMNKNQTVEIKSVLEKVDGVSDVKIGVDNVEGGLESTIKEQHKSIAASRSSVSDDSKRGPSSTIDGSSDSDSDSGSSSDSESEHEREEKKRRWEKILAEKAAARAVEVIKERENMVARLEGEKQSLEKILEDRAKQQAQEVQLFSFYYYSLIFVGFIFGMRLIRSCLVKKKKPCSLCFIFVGLLYYERNNGNMMHFLFIYNN